MKPPPPPPPPPPAPVPVEEPLVLEPVHKDTPFVAYWKKIGGGSLSVSIALHAVLLVIALVWIFARYSEPEKKDVDFLSGGGGGTSGNTKINKVKRNAQVSRAPSMRIVGTAANGSIALPDVNSSITSAATLSAASGMMSGTPGSGGGFGGGKGTGRGTGTGSGWGPGKSPGFTAKFLGLDTSGNNIIFCIDTSGSMVTNLKNEGIEALRRELGKAILSLPASAEFNLICFGPNGDIFKPKSVRATEKNKAEAVEFMKGYYGGTGFGRTRTERFGKAGEDSEGIQYTPLFPEDVKELAGTSGGSRIDLAMVAAFERNPSTLFVLSDGAPGTRKDGEATPMDRGDVIDLIHKKYKAIMKTGKLTVNTISFESNTADGREGVEFMKKLAKKFDGKNKVVSPSKI